MLCYRLDLRSYRIFLLALIIALAPAVFSGCLSLGGRTTHVHESPETAHRIEMLESRVTALERTIFPPPLPPQHFSSGQNPDGYNGSAPPFTP
jgi:hypothetical protein